MLTAATLATTSRSAGTAAAAAAATNSPRRRTLPTAPTPTHLWAPPTDQISPAARTACPTPRFHAYCPHCADSNYLALVQERASGMVCNVQVRALWSCGSDAPRLGLRACRLAIEWPLAPPAPPRAPLSPLPYPESQIARRQRSDRGEHNCMRAVHAGVTDYRLNAPEIAIGRPLLVENRPCEVCAAWSPQWKKKKSYLRRLVVHACCVPCASQGYHGDPHALENPWVCCLCAGCQKPKTPYPPLPKQQRTQRAERGYHLCSTPSSRDGVECVVCVPRECSRGGTP